MEVYSAVRDDAERESARAGDRFRLYKSMHIKLMYAPKQFRERETETERRKRQRARDVNLLQA